MNRFRKFAAALLLCTAAPLSGACDSSTDPSDGPVQLVSDISRNVIPPTGTATLTFRLENISDETVTLNFSSGCQILPYIATRANNRVVYPSSGWVCTTMISELTLKPGEAKTQEIVVFAATPLSLPPPGTVPLGAGDYAAYARVEAVGIEIQSASVPFTVQQDTR